MGGKLWQMALDGLGSYRLDDPLKDQLPSHTNPDRFDVEIKLKTRAGQKTVELKHRIMVRLTVTLV